MGLPPFVWDKEKKLPSMTLFFKPLVTFTFSVRRDCSREAKDKLGLVHECPNKMSILVLLINYLLINYINVSL